jgi:hypothetical protein
MTRASAVAFPRGARPRQCCACSAARVGPCRTSIVWWKSGTMVFAMITKSEAVWRHLLVRAFEGERRLPSITDLSSQLELGVSTVHKALQRPVAIGAVRVRGSGGIRVLDPWRLLMMWAGRRDLSHDVLAVYRTPMSAPDAERVLAEKPLVLGGFGAVVGHLQGNRIADYDQVLCYGSPDDLPARLKGQQGDVVITVLEPDPLLARYGRLTPLPQAYVDLFNTPGWPAERFVHALSVEVFSVAA